MVVENCLVYHYIVVIRAKSYIRLNHNKLFLKTECRKNKRKLGRPLQCQCRHDAKDNEFTQKLKSSHQGVAIICDIPQLARILNLFSLHTNRTPQILIYDIKNVSKLKTMTYWLSRIWSISVHPDSENRNLDMTPPPRNESPVQEISDIKHNTWIRSNSAQYNIRLAYERSFKSSTYLGMTTPSA